MSVIININQIPVVQGELAKAWDELPLMSLEIDTNQKLTKSKVLNDLDDIGLHTHASFRVFIHFISFLSSFEAISSFEAATECEYEPRCKTLCVRVLIFDTPIYCLNKEVIVQDFFF